MANNAGTSSIPSSRAFTGFWATKDNTFWIYGGAASDTNAPSANTYADMWRLTSMLLPNLHISNNLFIILILACETGYNGYNCTQRMIYSR